MMRKLFYILCLSVSQVAGFGQLTDNNTDSINRSTINNSKTSSMFVHHVFFWLKEPNNAESVKRFEKALTELVTIECIDHYYLGKPADTRREIIDSSYQYSLLVVFKDKKAHDIYQVHPIHDAFRKINSELSSKVLIYDSVGY